jgi:hypothetical protein
MDELITRQLCSFISQDICTDMYKYVKNGRRTSHNVLPFALQHEQQHLSNIYTEIRSSFKSWHLLADTVQAPSRNNQNQMKTCRFSN